MMRWQNCVVFETQKDFETNAEERHGRWFFSHSDISYPKNFPAYFELKDGYDYYWTPIEPREMLSRWEDAISELQTMYDNLEKIILDNSVKV